MTSDSGSRRAPVQIVRSVAVAAPREPVWASVVTPAGIDDELRPWLSMTMPPAYRDATIETVPTGVWLGRASIRLFGLIPVEYDDLRLLERQAPEYFHEHSRMRLASVWEHRRELRALSREVTQVTDRITVIPRVPVPGFMLRGVVTALFAHRHRRLRAIFD